MVHHRLLRREVVDKSDKYTAKVKSLETEREEERKAVEL